MLIISPTPGKVNSLQKSRSGYLSGRLIRLKIRMGFAAAVLVHDILEHIAV